MGASSTVPNGAIQPWSTWGEYNRIQFVVAQLLSRIQTLTLVKVISCTNAGGVSPVGSVNVQPCVNQMDSAGNPQPHGVIYNVPYLRLFGGNAGNAVILDPKAGDIGLCAFASRDVSQVVSTQAPANPGSNRSYDFSDALYIGGMLNGGTPTQYVQFNDAGISLVSPTLIILKAPAIQMGDGGSESPLMTKNFLDFWNTNVLPFLQGLGYTGPNPPADSVTTIVGSQ